MTFVCNQDRSKGTWPLPFLRTVRSLCNKVWRYAARAASLEELISAQFQRSRSLQSMQRRGLQHGGREKCSCDDSREIVEFPIHLSVWERCEFRLSKFLATVHIGGTPSSNLIDDRKRHTGASLLLFDSVLSVGADLPASVASLGLGDGGRPRVRTGFTCGPRSGAACDRQGKLSPILYRPLSTSHLPQIYKPLSSPPATTVSSQRPNDHTTQR